jgi:hypothetical protein
MGFLMYVLVEVFHLTVRRQKAGAVHGLKSVVDGSNRALRNEGKVR